MNTIVAETVKNGQDVQAISIGHDRRALFLRTHFVRFAAPCLEINAGNYTASAGVGAVDFAAAASKDTMEKDLPAPIKKDRTAIRRVESRAQQRSLAARHDGPKAASRIKISEPLRLSATFRGKGVRIARSWLA